MRRPLSALFAIAVLGSDLGMKYVTTPVHDSVVDVGQSLYNGGYYVVNGYWSPTVTRSFADVPAEWRVWTEFPRDLHYKLDEAAEFLELPKYGYYRRGGPN